MCSYRLIIVYKGYNKGANYFCMRLMLFPLILIICWTIPSIYDFCIVFDSEFMEHSHTWSYTVFMIKNCQGLLSSFAFIFMNSDLYFKNGGNKELLKNNVDE
jgi:hypothetical protein